MWLQWLLSVAVEVVVTMLMIKYLLFGLE